MILRSKVLLLTAVLAMAFNAGTTEADVLAATSFDGRTVTGSSNHIATDLNWTTNGIDDPGDMATVRNGTTNQTLFNDPTMITSDMFAPAWNYGNSGGYWTTTVALKVAAGSSVTLTDVAFDYWAISGAQVHNVNRRADFTVTLFSPSSVAIDSVDNFDVLGGAVAGVPTVISTFSAPIALSDPGTYLLEIKAGELADPDETGNHIGIDNLSINGTVESGMAITAITPDADPAKLSLSWESQAAKVYDIVGTTDPSADPQVWTPLVSDIAATPPENTESFTKPVDAFTAFAVLEKPLPPLFSDDFESDLGWTVGVDAGTDTDWERGTPSVIGPAAANSPVTCYGTNIDAAYGIGVNITLRSPAIDLSAATAATLSFQQFYDIEAGFDAGAVRVLKSSDLTQLGTDIVNPVDGTVTEWTAFTGALPAEALGETVVLEFRFTSDGFAPSAQAGWYIDDVVVTAE